jgi:hypothetical protein
MTRCYPCATQKPRGSKPIAEKSLILLDFFGATSRIRTDDLLIEKRDGAIIEREYSPVRGGH